MRGRKAKPEDVKLAAGNPGKRKMVERTPFAPAQPREDFPPPAHLSDAEKALWREEAARIDGLSLMRKSDTAAFAIYVSTLCRYRQAKRVLDELGMTYETDSKHGKMTRMRPEVAIEKDCRRTLMGMMDQFGMTSMSRIRAHSIVAATRQTDQPQLPLGPGGHEAPAREQSPIGMLNTVGNA